MTDSKFSILLVDDEKSIHEALGIALTEAGHLVGYAADGAIGFQMFLEGSWDVVVTDRAMPQMSGEQLAAEIKAISPKTPIILITGHLMEETRVQLFDAVLQKPFAMSKLLACVEQVLDATKR